ncbi:hypothetical protein AB1N83_010038 [Pleurotus pulmonarius]
MLPNVNLQTFTAHDSNVLVPGGSMTRWGRVQNQIVGAVTTRKRRRVERKGMCRRRAFTLTEFLISWQPPSLDIWTTEGYGRSFTHPRTRIQGSAASIQSPTIPPRFASFEQQLEISRTVCLKLAGSPSSQPRSSSWRVVIVAIGIWLVSLTRSWSRNRTHAPRYRTHLPQLLFPAAQQYHR